MGEKYVDFITNLYQEGLQQNEMKLPDFMQYHIYQEFKTKSMVVVIDSKLELQKSAESKEYKFIEFVVDDRRIFVHLNPLPQYDSKGDPKLDEYYQQRRKQYPHDLFDQSQSQHSEWHKQFEYKYYYEK
ncbi:unnamed protein product [Paramecium octaurelia]|uniref:Uncharacterized protein n=1 Tax=Paramecium octaurelia TaxID=43137 RepID=A0A8S1WF15_PAROT|nr:unnamed protein product [Paramecium octaurelia]